MILFTPFTDMKEERKYNLIYMKEGREDVGHQNHENRCTEEVA